MNKEQMMREPIIDSCLGCSKVTVGPEPGPQTCRAYLIPSSKWRCGKCPLADHIKKDQVEEKHVDPLKKSKQSMKIMK